MPTDTAIEEESMRLTRPHHRWSIRIILTFIFLLFHHVFYLPAFSQDAEINKITELIRKTSQLYKEGKYQEAIPSAIEVCIQAEKVLGPDHPEVARRLNDLAVLYKAQGQYDQALPPLKRSLAITEKALGPDHPDFATNLHNLAGIYLYQGQYAQALPLLKRSLVITEKALGPDHPNVASSLNNLAAIYWNQGQYDQALPLLKRSLAITEKALGPDHSDVARIMNNLAVLYKAQGQYAQALPLFKRSLAISEKVLGPDHPDVARSLNYLADFYMSQGQYAQALSLYKRSLSMFEKTLGPEHPEVAISLDTLASLYDTIGEYSKAELLFYRSLAIKEKTLGPDHPDFASTLNNLAGFYMFQSQYAQALSLYKRSIAINKKALAPDHPDVARNLNNLAFLYRSQGHYAQALSLYKRSLSMFEKTLGPEHPDVAISLGNLAYLYATMDKFQDAYDLLKRVQSIDEKMIDQVVGFTSESQKMKFILTRKWNLFCFLNLFNRHFVESPSARIDALNVWLKRKGVILESQKRFQEALIYSNDPNVIETFQKLSRTRSQLSNLIFSGPGKIGVEEYKNRIDQLQKQKEALEGKLSQLSQEYMTRKKIEKADTQKVAGSLPADTALVEFIRMSGCDFKAAPKEKKRPPDRYLAFILHAGKGDRVEYVDLGPADRIDQGIVLLKRQIISNKDLKIPQTTEAAKLLYDLVFKPLQKGIGKSTELFISPDGNLNLIPFEVLQTPEGRFLIEDYTFNYLAAGRDILGFSQINEKGTKALIMGDPDFDMNEGQKGDTLRKLALAQPENSLSAMRSTDMHDYFRKLPGTKVEVNKIMALLGKDKADGYTGREALEEVLINRGAPKILHLATHGFFLNDEKSMLLKQDELQRDLQFYSKPQFQPAAKMENPLVRSGIALAGANRTLNSGDPDQSDGLVTAEKILGLRLRGTDMVVLSACDTGLGEVQNGEGVYGLRRAFIQAGTKSLVMSMWSVPDRETQELMVTFYENIISGKMNRCQALRQAALKQMEITKKRYGQPYPLYWGAFVFLGEQ